MLGTHTCIYIYILHIVCVVLLQPIKWTSALHREVCSLLSPTLLAAVTAGEEPAEIMGELQRELPANARPLLPDYQISSSTTCAMLI